MSAEYPALTEHLIAHQWRGNFLGCECGWNWPDELTYFCGEDERIAKAHITHQADTWTEACTIRTVDQLDALPTGSAIRDHNGTILERDAVNGPWLEPGASWRDPILPALLLWHPDWSAS